MMKDTMPGPPHSGLGPRPGLGGEGRTGRLSYKSHFWLNDHMIT